jgi:hypothetical protein
MADYANIPWASQANANSPVAAHFRWRLLTRLAAGSPNLALRYMAKITHPGPFK